MADRQGQIIEGIKAVLVAELTPRRIILFGSRVKNNDSRADFDLAVDAENPTLAVRRKIKDKVEKIVGLYKADIVYLPVVDEEFKKIIETTGKVIYERN